uniref:Uncharacterized protein n=1 Tax=Panagrolaimus sp. PS1159 TaxID=55785 RepID=A0AC35GYP1_9BILA
MLQFTTDENKARNLSGVHFTTYTAEGRIYLPWIRKQAENYGVKLVQRHIETVNEKNDTRNYITDEDRTDIFKRYTALQPSFKKVPIKNEWVAFRPGRDV